MFCWDIQLIILQQGRRRREPRLARVDELALDFLLPVQGTLVSIELCERDRANGRRIGVLLCLIPVEGRRDDWVLSPEHLSRLATQAGDDLHPSERVLPLVLCLNLRCLEFVPGVTVLNELVEVGCLFRLGIPVGHRLLVGLECLSDQ